MKIKVTKRLQPERNQHRYRLSGTGFHKSGDVLPDVLSIMPAWVFPVVDKALVGIQAVGPWTHDFQTISVTIELK